MKANYFITSDGLKVDLVPGWYEQKHAWPYGIKDFNEFAERCFVDVPIYPPTNYLNVVNKVATFNYVNEILQETLTRKEKWPKALDIGTGPGIQPRLLKAAGLSDEVWGVDILDRENQLSDDKLFEYLTRLNVMPYSEDRNALQETGDMIDTINKGFGNLYPLPSVADMFNLDRPCSLDRYIVDDFLTWEPGSTKFDLVTALSCIGYFQIKDLLKKVNSLLNKAGVFLVIATNWHEICGGAMHLPMDAPWLHSRLSREDLLRYYKEIRPEISDAAERCIFFKESHMTPLEYHNAGTENHMRLLTCRRSFLPYHELISQYNKNENNLFSYINNLVLPQAKRINPYFRLPDAFTSYLTMVFIKE